jgi:hypothetical protein
VASLTNFAPRQFLERIVSADETWVPHYEPESKTRSVAWKRPTSPVAKKFRSQPSAGKITFIIFWDIEVASIFIFITASRTALGLTQPPIQWVPRALSLGVKWPEREADHSHLSSAEVKECVELYLHSPNTSS